MQCQIHPNQINIWINTHRSIEDKNTAYRWLYLSACKMCIFGLFTPVCCKHHASLFTWLGALLHMQIFKKCLCPISQNCTTSWIRFRPVQNVTTLKVCLQTCIFSCICIFDRAQCLSPDTFSCPWLKKVGLFWGSKTLVRIHLCCTSNWEKVFLRFQKYVRFWPSVHCKSFFTHDLWTTFLCEAFWS